MLPSPEDSRRGIIKKAYVVLGKAGQEYESTDTWSVKVFIGAGAKARANRWRDRCENRLKRLVREAGKDAMLLVGRRAEWDEGYPSNGAELFRLLNQFDPQAYNYVDFYTTHYYLDEVPLA